jgi:uncharacterized membrane protein
MGITSLLLLGLLSGIAILIIGLVKKQKMFIRFGLVLTVLMFLAFSGLIFLIAYM